MKIFSQYSIIMSDKKMLEDYPTQKVSFRISLCVFIKYIMLLLNGHFYTKLNA